MRLTDATVRNLQPELSQRVVYDDTLVGFGVRISPKGTKAFVLTFGANRERVTIGRYPLISLQDARTRARELLAERTLGKVRTPRVSISGALETYYQAHVSQLRPRTQKEVKRLLGRFLPSKGNLEDLTVHELSRILDKISSPSEGEHFHRAAKTFFSWCVNRHLAPASPLQTLKSPSRWKSRERVLSDDELRAVWRTADGTPGGFGKITQLLILTGARRGEIAALKPEWLNLENGSCTLPSALTKNKRPHQFPIGKLATTILKSPLTSALQNGGTYLFPARGRTDVSFNGFSKAKVHLDAAAGIDPWTLHDLRRTYATNLQRLGIRLEVIEALLNHVSGTRAGIVGVYQRHNFWDEMVAAVETFDDWFKRTILEIEEF